MEYEKFVKEMDGYFVHQLAETSDLEGKAIDTEYKQLFRGMHTAFALAKDFLDMLAYDHKYDNA